MATTRLRLAAFRLEPELLDGLDAVRARDGVPASEQVRRALRDYLAAKGVLRPAKKAATRRTGGRS